jgi:creatinine amidohydrolase
MPAKVKMEEMTPAEFHQAIRKRPIIYIPCGLLEWHGQHLPLGLDGLKIHGILLGCARRTGGVVMPVNWIGAPGYGSFCGTATYPKPFVKQLLKHMLGQSAKMGAKVIGLVTGHYGVAQVSTVKAAAAEFARENPGVRVLARPEYEGVQVNAETPADHAGKWETSMALALFPELTQMEKHRPGAEKIDKYPARYALWPSEKKPWVWGSDLRKTASPEVGRRAVAAIRGSIVGAIEGLCKEVAI